MMGLGNILRYIGNGDQEQQNVDTPLQQNNVPYMLQGYQQMMPQPAQTQRLDMFRQSNIPYGFGNLMRFNGGYYG